MFDKHGSLEKADRLIELCLYLLAGLFMTTVNTRG